MRYQAYKNKMMKIRKVIDFFHRFRFVFIGVAVATAASITTLDLTKGSITESSEFEISYVYGEDISYSGSAFMGKVTFEFRRAGAGDADWSEEEPHRVGQYEARGKSLGNHGYKYTKISTFEIKPYETTINLLNTSIDFGNDHPDLTYKLLDGDTINDVDVKIEYDDKTSRTTFARIDLDTVKVTDKDGNNITDCYSFTTEDKEITFNQAPLNIEFVQQGIFTYTGDEYSCDEYVLKSREPYYNAHIEITGGIKTSVIGKHDNDHGVRVIDEDGVTDYTANYAVKINDNVIEIEAAPAVTIKSGSLEKVYDAENFDEFDNPIDLIEVNGEKPILQDNGFYLAKGLVDGHFFKLVGFENENTYKVGNYENKFEFDIVDKDGNSIDRTLYKGFPTSFGTLDIKKAQLKLTTSALDVAFDNKYHSMPHFDVVDGLAFGDVLSTINTDSTSLRDPTSGIDNVVNFMIKHDEKDVTDCYELDITYKKITITVTPLKFKFTPVAFEYDGEEHSYYYTEGNDEVYTTPESHENAAVLDETYNKLPEGWTYDVHIPSSFKIRNVTDINDESKTPTKDDVVVKIYDNSEPRVPVTSYYINGDYLTFEMPKSSISEKTLNVTVKDYEKVYNNRTLYQDVVIDPNNPDTCVEYDGLVDGDLPDVTFLNGQNNKNANDGEGQEPYSLSVSYGVKDSNNKNLTDNYNMIFKNDKKTIDATITKKDIVVTPGDISRQYDGKKAFTPGNPSLKAALNEDLVGESVSLNANLVGDYLTTDSIIGDYEYDLDPRDITIKINGTTVTDNYNIHFEKKGNVSITERNLNLSYNNSSKPGGYIFYDKQQHGVFMNDDGTPSSEMTISGLISGHRVYIANTFSTSAVGDILDIGSSEDLGITIKDTTDDNRDVTSNYSISHTTFHIDIVQTMVTINSNILIKTYDGFSFTNDNLKNLTDGEFYSYSSTNALKNAYSVDIQSTSTGNKLQTGHELQLTRYTDACASAAVQAGFHQLDFDYRIINTATGDDVSDLYNITTNTGDYNMCVNTAEVYINCNSLGAAYNGQNCTAPTNGEEFILTTNTKAAAYLAQTVVGPRFSEKFSLSAQFDDGGYDPNAMYAAGTYSFNVTITVYEDGNGSYGMNDNPNIIVYINKGTFDYTITKSQIKLTTTGKSEKTGKELRRVDGALAPGDSVYFGGVELLEPNKRKVYNYAITDYVIIHEADGQDVTTTCYDVSVG